MTVPGGMRDEIELGSVYDLDFVYEPMIDGEGFALDVVDRRRFNFA